MKNLIVNGNPGFRKDALIEVDGEEYTVFQVNRQGDYHGPDRPQLWCVVGDEAERDDYVQRNYQPHFLDTVLVDAEDVEILRSKGT